MKNHNELLVTNFLKYNIDIISDRIKKYKKQETEV